MNISKEIELLKKSFDKIKEIKDYLRSFLEPPFQRQNIKRGIDSSLKGKEIGLVLSGGGARGVAHVGVLKALESFGIKPAFIVGTSAGAIVGALYGAGLSPDEIFIFYSLEEKSFKKLSPLKEIIPAKRSKILRELLLKYLPINNFKELEIPVYINSVDIKNCKRIIISEGDLIGAMMGSSAIPFVFEPVRYGDSLLVDGGVMDLFGIDIAREVNRAVFLKRLKLVVSDVSGITDESSRSKVQNIIINVSHEVADTINYLGKRKIRIESEDDIFSFINNLFYLIKRRAPLFPTLKKGEHLISPSLKGMSMFDFKDYKKAYLRGIDSVNFIS